MRLTLVAGAAILAALATPVAAEGWSVSDLGSMSDRDACMSRARDVFSSYASRYDVEESIGQSTWTVGGYDLRGETVDALIICPIEGGIVVPYLLSHGTDSDSEARRIIHDRLRDIWDEK